MPTIAVSVYKRNLDHTDLIKRYRYYHNTLARRRVPIELGMPTQQPPELRYQRVTYIPLCVREDEASIPSRPTANTFVEPQQFHVVNNNHILRQLPHFTLRYTTEYR
jgi:hypothetical protein